MPWLVRLFSRTRVDDVLLHPVRVRIAGVVAAEPGIHLAELCRRIGKGYGATRHHVGVMVEAEVLASRNVNGHVCYYPPDLPDPELQEIGGLLRSPMAKRLLAALAAAPGRSVAELAEQVGKDQSTVRYHLERFARAGLVRFGAEGRRSSVFPGRRAPDALDTFLPK